MPIRGKQLEDSAITTAKIAASAVTSAKVDSTVLVASGANPLTGDLPAGGNKITGLAAPTSGTDAANKAYVDATAQGLSVKLSVRLYGTSNVTLSGNQTIDGVLTAPGQRVLLGGQTTGSENGIWVTAAGAWARASDLAAGSSAAGAFSFIEEGTSNADSGWVCTNDVGSDVVGSNTLAFTQFSGAGSINAGTGLTKTGNTINVNIAAGSAGLTANADDLSINYALAGDLVAVDAGAASAGTSEKLVRADAKLSATTAIAVDVGGANSAGSGSPLALANHVHRTPVPTSSNKNMTASVTTTDNDQACSTTVTKTPAAAALGPYIGVRVNGIHYLVGDGTKVSVDAYLSGDGGTTARAFSAVVAGDTLRWNGSIAGFQLAATDKIDLEYLAF